MSYPSIDPALMFTFFAVFLRFSVLLAVLPFFGEKNIPVPVKILLSLAISLLVFPVILSTGKVNPNDALVWSASASGIVFTVALEVIFALAIGYTAKVIFMAIQLGANAAGTFMGFASAAQFDPFQESQSIVVARVMTSLAMLIFMVIDGHHILLFAALKSFEIVGIGQVVIGGLFNQSLMTFTGEMIRIGFQIAGPIAFSMFLVNIVYGVFAKSIPQMNILVLSFSISAFVGMFVLFFSIPGFSTLTTNMFLNIGEDMGRMMRTMSGR